MEGVWLVRWGVAKFKMAMLGCGLVYYRNENSTVDPWMGGGRKKGKKRNTND